VRIQQAATRSGLSPHTIRFYEREGVLPAPPRAESGYRDYTEQHLAILGLARGLKEINLPLVQMRAALAVAHDGTCGDLRSTLITDLEEASQEMRQRIAELERTGQHVDQLLVALRAMNPSEDRVPNMTPCSCVEIMERSK
jgi:DNA-binding transcriptional MerR regulator